MIKVVRSSTIGLSLNILLKGQLKYLSSFFEVIAISSGGKDLDIVRSREKVNTITVEMERGISPFKDLVSLIKLYYQFRLLKPQVVHSITPKSGLLSMLAAKMAGVPIRIHTFTGLIFPSKQGFLQKILIFMDKLLCWAATNIYPEGNGVKNDLVRFNITSKPLKIIGNGNVNGIDLNYFKNDLFSSQELIDLKSKIAISDNDFVFIFVGRLVGDKGINELIAAFSKLSTLGSVKLLLVGPMEDELDRLQPDTLLEISNNSSIITVGFQADVRPFFSIADALVFPSYREGFPNVVLQAGAMGLPSIVTDINGSNEIIRNNENGCVIPPKDTAALYNAMVSFVDNPDNLNNLKLNCRNYIANHFDQEYVWKEVLSEYQRLLAEKGIKH